MKITLSHYDKIYTVDGLPEDLTAGEVRETFDRLLVQAGYPVNINCADGGHFELKYIDEDETIRKEAL